MLFFIVLSMHLSCIFIGKVSAKVRERFAQLASASEGLDTSFSSLASWMEWSSPARQPDTEGIVPVVPVLFFAADQLELPAWRTVRVHLAESGRFFVVLLPGAAGTGAVVSALREGAYDAVAEDEPAVRWRQALADAARAETLWAGLFGAPAAPTPDGLVGRSAALQQLRELIARIGPTSASVLVLGESGTGKERVAEALHAAHGNGKGPFVAINCTALPRDLLEGELFGATKGAYTGASVDRPGLVEQADGGTLFLDELGDLDPALQPKLLRFLETRRARRLGGRAEYSVNVRIVAATNAKLRARVASGQFREDLFYRLAEFTIELPPLRERREDIALLCRHFLGLAAERHGKIVTSMEPALMERFQAWSWPGNIRELRSTIERLVILANGPVLREGAWSPPGSAVIPRGLAHDAAVATPAIPVVENLSTGAVSAAEQTRLLNKRQRRELAFRLLEESGGDQTWVAARLGIHPTTLYRWCRRNSAVAGG
jgi:DNA-binding NtrC family response regulator